jgi:hypothetical protein
MHNKSQTEKIENILAFGTGWAGSFISSLLSYEE